METLTGSCHCKDCQKSSGTNGSVNAMIPSSAFAITQGTPKRRRETMPEMTSVRIGTLDDAPPMKVSANIWTDSARPWAFIDPASKQFPGQP